MNHTGHTHNIPAGVDARLLDALRDAQDIEQAITDEGVLSHGIQVLDFEQLIAQATSLQDCLVRAEESQGGWNP